MENIKLIAADMDHTLLTEAGELPPNFGDYIEKLHDLKIYFAIASGRPFVTLSEIFADYIDKIIFISDNGAAISDKGEAIFQSRIEPEIYQKIIRFAEDKTDGIPILCGFKSGFLLSKFQYEEAFLKNFYSKLTFVDDMSKLEEESVKVTIYFPNQDSHQNFEQFQQEFGDDFTVTIGDTYWIDITNSGINKGSAMQVLGDKFHISTDQMAAFGDTHNDIEMLKTVKYSYLMANAKNDMRQYANYSAPSNEDFGVLKVLDEIIAAQS